MLTQQLLDDHLKQEVWSKDISPQELQTYYEQHQEEFNRPEQVRLADLFIALPANVTEDERAARRHKAEEALAKALAAQEQRTGFGVLIRQYSDTHPLYGRGDTGFFDREGKPLGIDTKLAEAAFALERVGSLSKEIIETSEGYHVIMLVGKRSATHKPFETVRQQLQLRIRREAEQRARAAFVAHLKARTAIQVNAPIVSSIVGELSQRAPKTSQPATTGNRPPASP